MFRSYSIIWLFFSFLFSSLTDASPHPQWGNRHRHGAVTVTSAAPATTVSPTTTHPTPGGNPIVSDSPSAGTGNGKRGLAYNSSSPSLTIFSNTDITWVHDWDSAPGDAPSQFMFVPTLWSDQSPHSDNWDQNAANHQYLMSFNEPDNVGQANMQVDQAVSAYKRLLFPKRSSTVQIGAPSVTSGSGTNEAGIPMGTSWLSQFLSQYDVKSFNGYVSDLVFTAAGRDVWIPEFQRYGDTDGQKQFLEAVLPTLDANNAVKRYAYYMVADGILTTNGQVNNLGTTFAG
ncbi:MAG: hypothetical protein LQ338_002258 [Usnochroma carphineum]|nr:MAG: hypothetical protein LQ338_002258 [Usnochroma carphineum]